MNLRKAIEKMCKQCIYDPIGPGGWRDQVEACTAPNCALYECRPVTERTKKARRQAEIAKMSPDQLNVYRKRVEHAKKMAQAMSSQSTADAD